MPLLAHALHSIPDAVTIANARDILMYVNPAFTQMYGYTAEEVIGKPTSILWAGNQSDMRQILPDTLQSGWSGEVRNRRKDGSEFHVQLTTSAVKDNRGNILALIGVAHDITEQIAVRQELATQREKIEAQSAALAAANASFEQHVKYSRDLQKALMSSSDSLYRHFPNCFVLREAAGPLPSDFFWVSTYLDRIFVALVDIHTEGMAGALMALLIQSLLVQVVHEDSRLQPDAMIELIQERLLRNLPAPQPDFHFDGVSLGIASISRNRSSCIYGGADLNGYVLRKGSFMTMEGSPQRLGLSNDLLEDAPHVLGLSLQPGDLLYLYTRGIYDMQNAAGQTLGEAKLQALLREVANHPVEQQRALLETTLRDWRGGAPLVSDIMLLAIQA